jgi:hypothetical protein
MKNGTKRARTSQERERADALVAAARRARLLCMAVAGIEGTVVSGSALVPQDVEPVGTLALELARDIERVATAASA